MYTYRVQSLGFIIHRSHKCFRFPCSTSVLHRIPRRTDVPSALYEPQVRRVSIINTLRPRQNGHRVPDDTYKRIFLTENVRISIKLSLKFVPKGPINNIPALVQIMAWRRSGDKPLSEPMMVSLLTYIYIYASLGLNELNDVFRDFTTKW